jgi:hypothetical protein
MGRIMVARGVEENWFFCTPAMNGIQVPALHLERAERMRDNPVRHPSKPPP